MSTYLKDALDGLNNTPQSRPIPGREADMARNDAGGYVFQADDFTKLRRFLVLGTEGGSYYASQRDLTAQAAGSVLRCLKANGRRTVQEALEVSREGRAPRNDQAIFVLAMACSPAYADEETRRYAFDKIPEICRTATHLFQFVQFVDGMRGWGEGLMKAVARWYEDKTPDEIAYQAVKYQQRGGWSHKDAIRLSHPNRWVPIDEGTRKVFDWIFGGTAEAETDPELRSQGIGTRRSRTINVAVRDHFKPGDVRREVGLLPDPILAYEQAQRAESGDDVVRVIERYGRALPHEAIPTQFKTDGRVLDALVRAGMPMTALIRNLGNLTKHGVLTPGSEATRIVVAQLGDEDAIRKARVHPVNMLRALYVYSGGRALKGGGRSPMYSTSGNDWNPVADVVDALDAGFYLAFGNVEGHGKRRLIAIDSSGSMYWPESQIGGIPGFYSMHGAVAMSLVSLHAGDPTTVALFDWHGRSHGRGVPGYSSAYTSGLTVVPLSKRQRLDDAIRSVDGVGGGGTDCALPIMWAKEQGLEFDVFEIYTDNQTWAGQVQPVQALRDYRRQSGLDARVAVIGMVANDFTIADPSDAGMLDVVGFDTAAPQLISDFGAGLV